MSKHYRIIKDHPLWDVGAILEKQDEAYRAISDIWTKELPSAEDHSNWTEGASLVENQPEWFERVYEISVLDKAKYLTKDAAKKAHEMLYKEK